jgi:hypothetical protein
MRMGSSHPWLLLVIAPKQFVCIYATFACMSVFYVYVCMRVYTWERLGVYVHVYVYTYVLCISRSKRVKLRL